MNVNIIIKLYYNCQQVYQYLIQFQINYTTSFTHKMVLFACLLKQANKKKIVLQIFLIIYIHLRVQVYFARGRVYLKSLFLFEFYFFYKNKGSPLPLPLPLNPILNPIFTIYVVHGKYFIQCVTSFLLFFLVYNIPEYLLSLFNKLKNYQMSAFLFKIRQIFGSLPDQHKLPAHANYLLNQKNQILLSLMVKDMVIFGMCSYVPWNPRPKQLLQLKQFTQLLLLIIVDIVQYFQPTYYFYLSKNNFCANQEKLCRFYQKTRTSNLEDQIKKQTSLINNYYIPKYICFRVYYIVSELYTILGVSK
eukprot:TRINITY_DN978_c0_g2_i10.p1 TRINITY_DN978_c0_g2~~TRINITY_DN978_c0_g2_i10.p1  ORF type:complete len:304 (-),score=-15.73 TRINITY_DN978_c0_g2_i10:857-1768(-)